MSLTGSELIVKLLESEGTKHVFGIPGGAIIPLCDALNKTDKVNFILTRHELWASHAADGYARVKQDVGVCIVTSGPGGTNILTGIANAYMDSVPLVAIIGQVPTKVIGTDAFQETDMYGCTLPVVKHSFLVKNIKELPKAIKGAFYIARTGRKRPVVIIVPVDIQTDTLPKAPTLNTPINEMFPGYKPYNEDISQLDKALWMLENAQRPVIIAGGGIISSGASQKLVELAEYTQIPVVNTLMGKSAIPESHPLSLGLLGMHGTAHANKAVSEADLLIALGTRFSDRSTGFKLNLFENKSLIHIDIDHTEIDRILLSETSLTGDLNNILTKLMQELKHKKLKQNKTWLKQINEWKTKYQEEQKDNNNLPKMLIEAIQKEAGKNCLVTTEVGQNQMWTALYWKTEYPGQFLTSGGLGAMGYGLPAAIGAYFANPDITPICISGDGSFFMNQTELDTCARYNIPVKVFVFNNKSLGMVRQWQQMFWNKNYAFTCYEPKNKISKIAEALGAKGIAAHTPKQMFDAIKKAFKIDGPVVVDLQIPQESLVLPMIPPGRGISEFITKI